MQKMSQEGESVTLPLPKTLEGIDEAKVAFYRQYHCAVQTYVTGQVTTLNGVPLQIKGWHKVVSADRRQNALGLSNDPKRISLLWVQPTGPGQLKLVELIYLEEIDTMR